MKGGSIRGLQAYGTSTCEAVKRGRAGGQNRQSTPDIPRQRTVMELALNPNKRQRSMGPFWLHMTLVS